jgi:hypothetical protein
MGQWLSLPMTLARVALLLWSNPLPRPQATEGSR